MNHLAKAPVMLLSDIDRGGVFASLYGTYQLLTDAEKAYVKGMVVNRFKGEVDLLYKILQERIDA